MIDQSQSCPSCRSSKYSNPQLKLMVNVCGHSLCENCVEVLFVRGSGLCAQCKTPIRKNNFRYQLFEDPLVQKEIDIRKKLLSDFNKREDDFDCLEEYNLYLEKIEDLIYNLTNDISVEETKRYIENYKKENKEIIKKNRTKPSHNAKNHTSPLQFVYEPYVVELCGPMPPLSSNRHIRWIDVLQMYEKTVIVKLNHQAQTPANTSETKPKSETEGEFNDADCGRTAVDIKANYKTEESFLSDDVKKEYDSDDSNHTDIKISALKVEDSCPTTKSLGLSCQLTAGACGISPAVFLERCLLESRCGLFM
uniref:CDK-activating kinase assembly factor MAT1 n=1 Tax=Schistosoma mansoni TaxID=6183 RepID=A0A3Q0KFB3_SCHMA